MGSMTLIWTTLPAGVRRKSPGEPWMARVSLMLSPRLDVSGDETTLADFPPFTDWPRTLREHPTDGIAFRLELRDSSDDNEVGTVTLPLRSVADPTYAADSQTWHKIFAATTRVRKFDAPEPAEDNRLKTAPPSASVSRFDGGNVVAAIRSLYGDALRRDLGLVEAAADESLPKLMTGTSAIDGFMAFHQPREAPLKSADDDTEAADDRSNEVPDFHQVVAALGNHPLLLRKLGLVMDFEVPLHDLPLDRTNIIRIVPQDRYFPEALDRAFWTAYDYRTGSSSVYRLFSVASSPGHNGAAGMLALGDDTMIAQENYEHAALSIAQQKKQRRGKESGDFPALLQGGMRVMHAAIPGMIQKAMIEQSRLERSLLKRKEEAVLAAHADAGGSTRKLGADVSEEDILYADQLSLGVRADVRHNSGDQWRSLCRRRIRYSTDDGWAWPPGTEVLDDEGFIEPTAYKDSNATETGLRATTDLFEWDGWSLVVPRPSDDQPTPTLLPSVATPEGAGALSTTVSVPPGSLEAQRFGRCYTFRTRSVFLAGVGLSAEEADELGADLDAAALTTQPTCCLRVESAKPPVTVRAQDRGWGEAGDIVVLRDADDKRFRTYSFKLHVLPPEVPLSMAEKHGVFDSMSPDEAWTLITNHRGRLARDSAMPDDDTECEDPQAIESETVTARELYAPYLPDPMVNRAVLTLPDEAGTVDLPRFDDLPRKVRGERLARSCRLVISAGRSEITARVSGRDVIVELTRGRMHTLKLAAKLSPEELAVAALAHQDWHDDDELSEAVDKLVKAAANGEAPLLAPSREIRVVYATQRPLAAPAFGRALVLPRDPNDTSARLADDALSFDRPSTGRIDIYARWDDPVDDPDADGWATRTNRMHAGGVDIDLEGGKPLDPIELGQASRSPLAHDFGDTRHHEVAYRAVATTRFADFYPPEVTGEPGNTTLTSESIVLHVPSTAAPAAPDVAYVIPTYRKDEAKPVRNMQGRHSVELRGAGLRVYLQRGWFSSGKGEQLAVVLATPNTPEELRGQVSEWGVNPLREAAPLPGPLEMAQVWGGAERIEHWPLEQGSVGLVIHDVHWSEEHKLPFVDIEFMSQRAFMPLVRLGLARYQQHAIENCELSDIVHADFVPLTPGRALTVTKLNRTAWKLEMRGYSYVEPGDSLTPEPEIRTSIVEAQIEVMPADAPEDDAAWRPVGDPMSLRADSVEPWRIHWSGQVRLAEVGYVSMSWRRRLVIREYEVFATDSDSIPMADRSRLISAHQLAI